LAPSLDGAGWPGERPRGGRAARARHGIALPLIKALAEANRASFSIKSATTAAASGKLCRRLVLSAKRGQKRGIRDEPGNNRSTS
jgi:hypothetical protein